MRFYRFRSRSGTQFCPDAAAAAATPPQLLPPRPPILPHSLLLLCMMKSPCAHLSRDADARPDGWIPLVVAENKLGNAAMLERMAAVTDCPTLVLNYSGCACTRCRSPGRVIRECRRLGDGDTPTGTSLWKQGAHRGTAAWPARRACAALPCSGLWRV